MSLVVVGVLPVGGVAADSLDNPPWLKWSRWFPLWPSGASATAVASLPEPVENATMALVMVSRTDEGLYVPAVFLIDGTNGFVTKEIRGFSGIIPYDAIVLDIDHDGHRQEMVIAHDLGLTALDLATGIILWQWIATSYLAGKAVLVEGTDPLMIALGETGAIYAVYLSNGTLAWTVPGVENWWGLWTAPALVNLGESSGVVAVLPPVTDPWGAILVPPQIRLVDLSTRVTRWRVPLGHLPIATVPLVTSVGPIGDAGIVISDGEWELAIRAFDGQLIWNTTLDSPIMDFPFPPLVVNTPTGQTIVAPTYPNGLLRIDPKNGAADLTTSRCGTSAVRMLPADFHGNGFPEVITATSEGSICVHSVPQFDLLWNYSARTAFTAAPGLGDFDDDQAPELVTVSDDGWVDAYDLPFSPLQLPGPDWKPTAVVLGSLFAGVAVAALWILVRRRRRRGTNPRDTVESPGGESSLDRGFRP